MAADGGFLRRLYAETARLVQQEPTIHHWRVVVLCPSCQPTRKKSSLPTRKSPHSWGAFFPLFRPWVGSLPGAVEQLQTVCDASLK